MFDECLGMLNLRGCKRHYPIVGHFKPPTPFPMSSCHLLTYLPPLMMSFMFKITTKMLEIPSNQEKRMADWGPLQIFII